MKKNHGIKKVIYNNLYILNYVKKAAPGYVLLTILISLTALVDTLSNTWLSKIVFDGMEQMASYGEMVKIVLCLLFFMLISAFVRAYYTQNKSVIEKEKIKTYIRTILLEKTRNLDFACFETPDFYDKYTRAMAEADSRAVSVTGSVSAFSYSLFTITALFTIILVLDPLLLVFVIMGVLITLFINEKLSKARFEYNNERTPYERGQNYIHRIFYEPQYAQNIKMDTMVSYFINQYRELSSKLILIISKSAKKIEILEFLTQIQSMVLQIIMILFLTYRVFEGMLSIGDYAALLNSTFALIFQLNHLSKLVSQFYEHSLFIDNLIKIMKYEPVIEKEEGYELDDTDSLTIEFRNVSFRYPNQEVNILNHVSFVLHAGETTALVGENGAGKSTIVKLIIRLYDVTEGYILINGRDIREYNIFSLRRHFGIVFQDCQLYAATVADNVLGFKYSDELKSIVDESLRQSGLYKKIYSLPNNIETNVSKEFDENGILFSGGENQKIALAKVFARKSAAVILDEPSSSLDPISEFELNENMMAVCSDRAVLLISHRLSTTKAADHILVLAHGEVIEEGTHGELMEKQGLYKRMFESQAMHYQLESIV